MTPLEAFLRRMGYQPNRVIRHAGVIAQRLGMRTISRQQFHRIRFALSGATESTIYLIVATLRDMSGMSIGAANLFRVEPEAAGRGGAAPCGSVFSPAGHRPGSFWMPDEEVPSESLSERLERLYLEHAGFLRTTAKLRHGVPQEDVDALVHDVFVSYMERQPSVNDIRAYLLAATNNACMYYWRKRKRETPLLVEHEQMADDSASQRADRWAVRLSLGAALAQLGPKCRETLHRYYIANEDGEAIARGLQTTAGYVRQLLHTCRKRVREIYMRMTEPRR